MTSSDIVLLNHRLIPRQEAFVPIGDRGLMFGDGVFETILVRDGFPYLFHRHMQRLMRGLEVLQIGLEVDELERDIYSLIHANEITDGIVRLTVTRGEGSKGYLPYPEMKGTQPTVIGEVRTLPAPPPEEVILSISRLRKPPASALPNDVKHLQGLNSTLARMEAERAEVYDSILLDVRGYIAECSSHNIFWSRGRTLYTPHLGTGCLAGVMRQRLMDISGFAIRQGYYTLGDLAKADGVLLTNSVSLVTPVHGIKDFDMVWKNSDKLAKIYMMSLEQDIATDVAETRERYDALGWI